MITIDGIEYKDNLKLKCFSTVRVECPASINSNSLYITMFDDDVFIFNDELYCYVGSYQIYKWNGISWDPVVVGNSSVTGSPHPIIQNNKLYSFYLNGTKIQSTIPHYIDLDAGTDTFNNSNNFNINNYYSGEYIRDVKVVDNVIYMLSSKDASASTFSAHLSIFDIENRTLTPFLDLSSYKTDNNIYFSNLVNYKDELYLFNNASITGINTGFNTLYKYNNGSIQEICRVPIKDDYYSTEARLTRSFVADDNLYIYMLPNSTNYNNYGCYYIWKFNDEEKRFERAIEFPLVTNNSTSNASKNYYSPDFLCVPGLLYWPIWYNKTLFAFDSNKYMYRYNFEEKTWLGGAYNICKIDDSDITT